MSEEVKLCALCRMHKKIPIGPAGALWLEKDSTGDALLMVEDVVGRRWRAGGISGREKKKRRKVCCR